MHMHRQQSIHDSCLTVLKFEDLFEWNLATQTRGHAFKLYKRNCAHRTRAVFFQSVLSIYGTNYLFQPILDPYDYSCIVSTVWIYPVIYIYNFSMYVCIFSVSCVMSNGFIRLCSMVFCWAAISACHALLSSHMTNKDDDDDVC